MVGDGVCKIGIINKFTAHIIQAYIPQYHNQSADGDSCSYQVQYVV